MEIDYCEGQDIEDRTLWVIRGEKALASDQAPGADLYDEWPIRYHLSPERGNLLRHLDFSGLDVLELGAGMGGVSRLLAERAKSLTVVEGTRRRFDGLSARLRDLSNWTGIVGNLQGVDPGRRFDVVCVVGVLEYAELYVTPEAGESSFLTFLRRAAGHLKKDGVLVLAIENRLGLKYLSGAPEDHSGRLFDGIAGYPFRPSPKTFSLKELRTLFREAGLPTTDEYFPFPDYKIPSCVLSREMVECFPELAADIAASQPFESYGVPRARYFPDSLALRGMARAGLLAELSNSFLVLGSPSESSPTRKRLTAGRERGELAWHYSMERSSPVVTTFRRQGELLVAGKAPLRAGPPTDTILSEGDLSIRWKAPEPSPVRSGEKLRTLLANRAYYGDWDGFLRAWMAFLRWSLREWSTGTEGTLRGEALDAIFINVSLPPDCPLRDDPTRFESFDLEWSLEGTLPASWFVLRNVMSLSRDKDLFSAEAPFASFRELYELSCRRLGIPHRYEEDLSRECRFQCLVSRRRSLPLYRYRLAATALMTSPFPPGAFPRTPLEEAGLRQIARRALSLIKRKYVSPLLKWAQSVPGWGPRAESPA